MARRKHEKETKIMIDTRERFTRRFQFDKLSHQLASNTPTETKLSGSAYNQLSSYDSKTIFRNAKREPAAERVPQTYAHMVANKSPSLPNLTRNFSANQSRVNLMSESVLSDLQNRAGKGRNQRPTSSINDHSSQPFWKTMNRRQDGRSMVIAANINPAQQEALIFNK